MPGNMISYTCPVCGSCALYYNVKTGVMKCSKCGNRWFAVSRDLLLPTEGFEEIATEKLP